MKLTTVKLALVAAATLALAPQAFAHKAKDNHTHCAVGGKGVSVAGSTDAERKSDCTKQKGSWDEKKTLTIDPKGMTKAEAPKVEDAATPGATATDGATKTEEPTK